MQTITIKQYVTKYNDFSKAGTDIFDVASSAILGGEEVLLDMKGQDSVSTVFLNASIGRLIDQFGVEKVKKNLKFANLLRTQMERIRKYFEDYQELYPSKN